MLLPTTEYDIPRWLQQVLHLRFNKIIDGLTGVGIALSDAKHRYAKQDASDNDNAHRMMAANDLIQELATYVSRQRYNLIAVDVNPHTLDNCDMAEIITAAHLPLICSAAIEWCDTPNLPVQAPQTHLQAVLTNLIDACQQICVNAGSGDVKLWMQQTAQFNQLYLQCSAALNFDHHKDTQAGNGDMIYFYLSLKACERLLTAINGKVEISPQNNQQGVVVILSFLQEMESIE